MIYTIGGKKEYEAIINNKGYKLGFDWRETFTQLEKKDNNEEWDFSIVRHGGSVWETFDGAQKFLETTPNEFTPPDVNPETHAVFGVDANWEDTYQIKNMPYRSLLYDSRLVEL